MVSTWRRNVFAFAMKIIRTIRSSPACWSISVRKPTKLSLPTWTSAWSREWVIRWFSRLPSSGVDPIPLEGHLTLNSTAACVHRRSNFYASIVGMGKNRRGLEIYGRELDPPRKLLYFALGRVGWLSDSNNYGEYVRNCSVFLVPADEQGVVKYENAGCAFPGWHWSHWWESHRHLCFHFSIL